MNQHRCWLRLGVAYIPKVRGVQTLFGLDRSFHMTDVCNGTFTRIQHVKPTRPALDELHERLSSALTAQIFNRRVLRGRNAD